MKIDHKIVASFLLFLMTVVCIVSGVEFLDMRTPDVIYPSEDLTKIGKLSDYFEELKDGSGDTDIYFFEGKEPGATVLLLCGTHPNEASGFIAGVLATENVKIKAGRLLIIPQACLSGFSCTDPMEGYPQSYTLESKSGERKFRFGSRVSNPLDQWPDPLVYSHFPSGQKLSGFETRNLNRSYPGRPDGTFTEKVGYAIVQLIKKEKIDLAFDLHEAAPEIPIINAIIYHEKSEDIGLNAILNLEFRDLRYAPERSPENFHGLSHREWGDNTDVYPFLMETCNPIQGRLRGRTNSELILTGKSPQYLAAQETGKLRIEYDAEGVPLDKRVARHLQGFLEIVNSYNEFFPEKTILLEGLPEYEDLLENGLSNYLK
ncbi:MAG: succinylglutamate desuccinylase/aspartoacylase family protein [Bacteroidetes bacterium]|nr:succinylglutamate desuccinylase/aspartoacylase family protein [Bacteroidota bacterium]